MRRCAPLWLQEFPRRAGSSGVPRPSRFYADDERRDICMLNSPMLLGSCIAVESLYILHGI